MNVKELREAVGLAGKFVSTTGTIAVMSAVKFTAGSVQSTDMESWIEVPLDHGAEAIVRPKPILAALNGAKPDVEVSLVAAGGKLTLELDGVRTSIESFPLDEFPEQPAEPAGVSFILTIVQMDTVRAVMVAACTDETRPVLTSLHLAGKAGEDALHVEATDSYRFHRDVLHLAEPLTGDVDVCLPSKAVAKIPKGVGVEVGESEEGQVAPRRASLRFGDGVKLSLRTIEGKFPDVDQLLPPAAVWTVLEEDAAKRVMRVAKATGRCSPLRISPQAGTRTMIVGFHADSDGVEESGVGLQEAWDREAICFGVNARFFTEALVFAGVRLGFCFDLNKDKPEKVSVLRPILVGDVEARCALVMPVRLFGGQLMPPVIQTRPG